MTTRAASLRARVIAFGALMATAPLIATCNLFADLENCARDADCPSGACRLDVGRCVPSVAATTFLPDAGADGDAGADADAGVPAVVDSGTCVLTTPFGPPVNVPGLAQRSVISARLSIDETTMFVSYQTDLGTFDLATATRGKVGEPFQFVASLPVVTSVQDEYWPTLSSDGLLLFFESSRASATNDAGEYEPGPARIWSATRKNVALDFEPPKLQAIFDLAGAAPEAAPYLHPNGRTLYFASIARPGLGSLDLFTAEIDPQGVVGDVRNLSTVNSSTSDNAPVVSFDDRELFFARPDDLGNDSIRDVYVARRTTPADGFGKSERVAALSSTYDDLPTWVSPDGCRVYFVSNRPVPPSATTDLYHVWVASRGP